MRYHIYEEPQGTWSVWDSHFKQPAAYFGVPAVGGTKEFAEDLQAVLESIHLKRELTRKHKWF